MSDYSTILTAKEIKLIQEALKIAYKPKLGAKVENDAKEVEKKFPVGSACSVKAYTKGDGVEMELVAIEIMQNSKDKGVAAIGQKISNLFLDSGIRQTGKEINSRAYYQLVSLEDLSPMGATFKVARKLQVNGRDK